MENHNQGGAYLLVVVTHLMKWSLSLRKRLSSIHPRLAKSLCHSAYVPPRSSYRSRAESQNLRSNELLMPKCCHPRSYEYPQYFLEHELCLIREIKWSLFTDKTLIAISTHLE